MKLLLCRYCVDIVQLRRKWRYCLCGKTRGRYIGNLKAVIEGDVRNAEAVGINTDILNAAVNANLILDVPLQSWLYKRSTENITFRNVPVRARDENKT